MLAQGHFVCVQDVLLQIEPAQMGKSCKPQAVVGIGDRRVAGDNNTKAAIDVWFAAFHGLDFSPSVVAATAMYAITDATEDTMESQEHQGSPRGVCKQGKQQWRAEQAKLGLVVGADREDQVSCLYSLEESFSLHKNAVDVRTASPESFRRAMIGTSASRQQRDKLLQVFQAETIQMLGQALRAIKARKHDGTKLLRRLMNANLAKLRFDSEYLRKV